MFLTVGGIVLWCRQCASEHLSTINLRTTHTPAATVHTPAIDKVCRHLADPDINSKHKSENEWRKSLRAPIAVCVYPARGKN